MKPELNPDYELIYIDEEKDKMFFRNKFYKNLLSLSTTEFEIIQSYVDNPDTDKLFIRLSEKYEIGSDFVPRLISKAEETGLLESEGYNIKKKHLTDKSDKRLQSGVIFFLISKLQRVLKWLKINSEPELKGDFYYFGLLVFPLENTWLEKSFSRRRIQNSLILGYFILMAAALFMLRDFSMQGKSWGNLYHVMMNNIPVFILLLIAGMFLFSFLHELGHFLLYKRFGGITSEMGLALMNAIIPIASVTTNSLYLWKSRARRILVTLGGVMVDFLLLLLCMIIYHKSHSPSVCFYAMFFGMYLTYRLAFNLNPFLPRTDGYFVLCEFLSNSYFYKTVWQNFKSGITKLKTGKITLINRNELAHTGYLMVSFVFITINYFIVSLPLLIWIISLINRR